MTKLQFIGQRSAKPNFSCRDYANGERLSDMIHKIGHDIGNPLTSIISLGSLLQRIASESKTNPKTDMLDNEKLSLYLDSMVKEAWRISSLNERMVLLLSDRPNNQELAPVARICERAIQKLQSSDEFEGIDAEFDLSSEELSIQIDPAQFQVLISELLKNAYEWSKDLESESNITIIAFTDQEGETNIEINNEFNANLPKDLENLFLPFEKGSADSKNIGLGLTVAWAIVERAGGKLEIAERAIDSKRVFTTRVKVPSKLVEIDLSSGQKTKNDQKHDLPEETSVLIIEDESTVATAIARILSVTVGKNSTLETKIVSGQEALELFDSKVYFDAILCDLNLSDIHGMEIYEYLQKNSPEAIERLAFITGDQNTPEVQNFLKSSNCPFLFKPFETEDLIDIVTKLVLHSSQSKSRSL